jgi:hypothetical protein
MQHWVNAFGAMALLAAPVALADWGVVSEMGLFVFWLFAALAALALVTGAFGRGRNGLYSAERAVATVAVSSALIAVAFVWVANAWTAEDAVRALDRGAVEVAALGWGD